MNLTKSARGDCRANEPAGSFGRYRATHLMYLADDVLDWSIRKSLFFVLSFEGIY